MKFTVPLIDLFARQLLPNGVPFVEFHVQDHLLFAQNPA